LYASLFGCWGADFCCMLLFCFAVLVCMLVCMLGVGIVYWGLRLPL
jgi:hypothetical protein